MKENRKISIHLGVQFLLAHPVYSEFYQNWPSFVEDQKYFWFTSHWDAILEFSQRHTIQVSTKMCIGSYYFVTNLLMTTPCTKFIRIGQVLWKMGQKTSSLLFGQGVYYHTMVYVHYLNSKLVRSAMKFPGFFWKL